MPQFGRRATLTAGPSTGGAGFSWTGHDLNFSVIKTDTSEPNTARVEIYNLSPESRSYLLTEGLDLILSAGYQDAERVIFRGDLDLVTHDTATHDKRTTIQGLDGKRARGRRVTRSYPEGSALRVIVDDLVDALGLPRGSVLGLDTLTGQRVQGLAVAGPASRYLDTILASSGLSWSIQDGVLQVYPAGSAPSTQATLISPSTGLIGAPERTTEETPDGRKISGLQVVTLLDPLAAPGLRVQVDSEAFKGVYRTRRVEHRGAIDGQGWYTVRDLRE